MPGIKLQATSVNNIQSQIRKMIDETENAQAKVKSAIAGLDFEVSSKNNIRSRLNAVKNNLGGQVNLAGQYNTAFNNIASNLIATDEKNGADSKSIFDKIKTGVSNVFNNIKSFFTDNKLKKYGAVAGLFLGTGSIAVANKSTLWDLLKKAGHFGVALSLGESLLKGGASGIAKTAKYGYKLFTGVGKDLKKLGKLSRIKKAGNLVKQKWKERIFGLEDFWKSKKLRPSTAKNPLTKWKNNFNKVGNDSIKLTKSSWIGLAFDGIINGIDNYSEHGSVSARMVSETLVETAWDVAVATVATAATAAVLGSGAPVIAVAAGAMAITTGLDVVTNWVTGTDKGFTEVVSDGLLDGAEWVGEKAGKVISNIGDSVSRSIKSIKTSWKKCFNF